MSIQNDTSSKELHNHDGTGQWKGFADIDQAIHENRLTEYRMKKAWADPWGKRLFLMIGTIFIGFAIFVVIQDVI